MSECFIPFEAYHTCNLEGPIKIIFDASPYKSDPKKSQWLGNGYYFWTDCDLFAHHWGRLKYEKGYVITKYSIQIPKHSLLDLVGNVQDQIYFKGIINIYAEKLGIELKNKEDAMKIPISRVLEHLRLLAHNDEKYFSFKAIRAVDYQSKDSRSYPFLDNGIEKIVIPSRQQLYLENLEFLEMKQLHGCYQYSGKSYNKINNINLNDYVYKYSLGVNKND